VRVGPQGVKAKWVRIELRKVETLPTGGPANTFFDHVGAGPICLWSSPEYGILHTVSISSTARLFLVADMRCYFYSKTFLFLFEYLNLSLRALLWKIGVSHQLCSGFRFL